LQGEGDVLVEVHFYDEKKNKKKKTNEIV